MRDQRGFTIVELLIATTIISVILLMVSVMMINIGNLLHKGISVSKVQEDVRTISDELADQIKNSSGAVLSYAAGNYGRVCVNGTMYTFVKGVQMGSGVGKSAHVLAREPLSGSCTNLSQAAYASYLAGASPSMTELVYDNSRLYQFEVKPETALSGKTYSINVGVAYGDDDLLCSPTGSGCTPGYTSTASDFLMSDLTCGNSSSRAFCATAKLSTQVTQRL